MPAAPPRRSPTRRSPTRSLLVRSLLTLALGGTLVAPATACRTRGAARAAAEPPITVSFVNQALEQANVFAIGPSGQWLRVGTVAAGQTSRLRIPPGLVGGGQTISLVARRLATSRVASTGPLVINPGDELTVTLPPAQDILNVLPGGP